MPAARTGLRLMLACAAACLAAAIAPDNLALAAVLPVPISQNPAMTHNANGEAGHWAQAALLGSAASANITTSSPGLIALTAPTNLTDSNVTLVQREGHMHKNGSGPAHSVGGNASNSSVNSTIQATAATSSSADAASSQPQIPSPEEVSDIVVRFVGAVKEAAEAAGTTMTSSFNPIHAGLVAILMSAIIWVILFLVLRGARSKQRSKIGDA